MTMNAKMKGYDPMENKRKIESWKQIRKQPLVQRRCPVMKVYSVPRQTRRGC